MRAAHRFVALLTAFAVMASSPASSGQGTPRRIVTQSAILDAMRASSGFDPTATTNAGRFQAEVLLRIAREAQRTHPSGEVLVLDHRDWFEAFLKRAAIAADDAPLFMRLAVEHGQDTEVEYGPERVVRRVVEGPSPVLALTVRVAWPRRPGMPDSYSYEDRLSTPRLKVTNTRVMIARLLDFGDMMVWDDMDGLRGRPTSGALALLCRVIGEGRLAEWRMSVSSDGLQVSFARMRKAFLEIESTLTVHPNGLTEKDLPSGRRDLQVLESRLKRPLRIEYQASSLGSRE